MRFRQFDYLQTADSTSDYLKPFIESGRSRVAIAKEQTGGRGQFGRAWHSPAGMGLYVSYLLFPGWAATRGESLTHAAAMGVLMSILSLTRSLLDVSIKQPNDILLGGKKCAGILIEMGTQSDRIQWAIIGIGVNLYHQSFPNAIATTATSLLMEGVSVPHPMAFVQELTHHLEKNLFSLQQGRWKLVEDVFKTHIQTNILENGNTG